MVANLPESLRKRPENILLHGIAAGPKEPASLQGYLGVIVDDLLTAYHTGHDVTQARRDGSETVVTVRTMLLLLMADYPGLCKLLNRGSNGGNHACTHCWFGRVDCPVLGARVFAPTGAEPPAARTATECADIGRQQEARRYPPPGVDVPAARHAEAVSATGVYGPCEFHRLAVYFDTVKDATFDLMHVNSGVWGSHLFKLFAGKRKVAIPIDPRVKHKWGPDCDKRLAAGLTAGARERKMAERKQSVAAWEDAVRLRKAYNATMAGLYLTPDAADAVTNLYNTIRGPRDLAPARRDPIARAHAFKSHGTERALCTVTHF